MLGEALPQLFTTDLAASCAFYRDKLGFGIVFTYGEPPFYAQVGRGGARLNIRHLDRPAIDAGRMRAESLLAATITLAGRADLERLFAEYQAAGVAFHQALLPQPWGALDFIVIDPTAT